MIYFAGLAAWIAKVFKPREPGPQKNVFITGTSYTVSSGSISANLAGGPSVTLTKDAAVASVVLSGSNSYQGNTYVNGGTLQIGNGGTGEALASPSIAMSNSATVVFNHADNLSYGGAISGTGS